MSIEERPNLVAGKDGDAFKATIDAQSAVPWNNQKGWYDLLAQIAKDESDDKSDNR
ncbi:hypothetical protein GJ688_18255 [Heliobacillus mobilis]|uniref:Uncharacterized protein n=1 Tax=Heliobacterium mobile TaxID=28064 RepID=A0A6I3SP91_HELMO|nr:hypothetical protein [Heliobacterium mobile]MTV50870.1 hypothetical protein [Heliobacterium mobile]